MNSHIYVMHFYVYIELRFDLRVGFILAVFQDVEGSVLGKGWMRKLYQCQVATKQFRVRDCINCTFYLQLEREIYTGRIWVAQNPGDHSCTI